MASRYESKGRMSNQLMAVAGVDLKHEGNKTGRRTKTYSRADKSRKENAVCFSTMLKFFFSALDTGT